MGLTRDANYQTVGAAVTNDLAKEISDLLMDPVTGRLEIEIIVIDTPAPVAPSPTAKIDENFVPVAMGATDDANDDPRQLLVDSTNGYLLVDVLTE